jgi:hypothetical protein
MIKLTKTIAGKEAELDVIFLNGKTVVRNSGFDDLKKKGITKAELEEAGYGLEVDELAKIESKKKITS